MLEDDLEALNAPLRPGEPGYDEDDDHFELTGFGVHVLANSELAHAS